MAETTAGLSGVRRRLESLLADPSSFATLETLLASESRLPGPRGNLELAAAFGDCFAGRVLDRPIWQLLRRWLAITPADAPTGDPREFLPFCALQALGAGYSAAGPPEREEILDLLRRSASDERWRVREGVAMGFQRIAEVDFGEAEASFRSWLPSAPPIERRAIVASLAHPPALRDAARVAFCLEVSDSILAGLVSVDRPARQATGARVLRQGLEYALSVFVAAAPEPGFAFLRKWASVRDADVRRIVRANLGKARLAKRHPAQVMEVAAILGGHD